MSPLQGGNKGMIAHLYIAACIMLTGIGQLFLKMGAKNKKNPGNIFLNPFTLIGYLLILSATVFTVLALKTVDLKVLYALMALNYIVLLALSKIILDESITVNKFIATVLVFTGVVIFNI
jgi:multidrug transporter EmrE-like cation transporter